MIVVPPYEHSEELLRITPRALAGPGRPGTALQVLQAAGWSVKVDRYGNAACWSSDRLLYVGFEPEGWADSLLVPQDTRWQVVCYRDVGKRVWTATFDDDTPSELIAGFLANMVDPSGVIRDSQDPASMLHPPAGTAVCLTSETGGGWPPDGGRASDER